MDKAEREQFEAWIKVQPGHPYAAQFANLMWRAWQARAQIPASAPSVSVDEAPTEDMIIAGMEASVLGRPSMDDDGYVLSIWNAMNSQRAEASKANPNWCDGCTPDNCPGCERKAGPTKSAEPKCPACNGNNTDAPCAFPEGGQPGCLKDAEQPSGELGKSAEQEKVCEWVDWNGAILYPETEGVQVVVRFRDGEESSPLSVENSSWKHTGRHKDIVAYRIVEKEQP